MIVYMRKARTLGNYVRCLVEEKGISISDLCRVLDLTEDQIQAFFFGGKFISYAQLSALSEFLGVSIEEMLEGDEEQYNNTVVCSFGDFDDVENRELVLDIIDDYLDVMEAVG